MLTPVDVPLPYCFVETPASQNPPSVYWEKKASAPKDVPVQEDWRHNELWPDIVLWAEAERQHNVAVTTNINLFPIPYHSVPPLASKCFVVAK